MARTARTHTERRAIARAVRGIHTRRARRALDRAERRARRADAFGTGTLFA